MEKKTLDWAEEKDLMHAENRYAQYEKFEEEKAEFEEAWKAYEEDPSEENYMKMAMEFGDIMVTLIIYAGQMKLRTEKEFTPSKTLEMAYKKISKRKGKTIDGTFVKNEDLGKEND